MIEITRYQVNKLFEFTEELATFKEGEWISIDKNNPEIKKWFEGDFLTLDLLNKLDGYQFNFDYEGDHRNDGQMVDYFLNFKNQEEKQTAIHTEMCLMVGFNHCKDETIK